MGAATPDVVEYVSILNRRDGFASKPVAFPPPVSFAADVSSAILELPAPVQALVKNRVIAIFIVKGLWSSGFSEFIFDEKGVSEAAFIVLDFDYLDRPANDWFTWKESLPFRKGPNFEVKAFIEPEADNNRKQAVQFLLLHELGHVAAIRRGPTGSYTTFFSSDWESLDNTSASAYENVFPQRKSISYYAGHSRFDADVLPAAYDGLRKTSFPTLYGATSPRDDYAETFAVFVHSVLMNKPYSIQAFSQGKKVYEYNVANELNRLRLKFSYVGNDINNGFK